MRKIFNPSEGERLIYLVGYNIKEATVVSKPIDGERRPSFRIGRIDLDNGDYLINGSIIYDSIEEAKNEVLKKAESEIESIDEKILFYQAARKAAELIKNDLLTKFKVESQN